MPLTGPGVWLCPVGHNARSEMASEVAKMEYGKVTAEVVEALRRIAGAENVVVSPAELEKYGRDEMLKPVSYSPEVVVKPVDAQMVARVLRLADERRVPVTPRGAGTGLSGGAVPIFGGISLSMENMNRILAIDEDNFVATVEPGVTLGQLWSSMSCTKWACRWAGRCPANTDWASIRSAIWE